MSELETDSGETREITPQVPLRVEDTGLDYGFLADLRNL